MSGARREPSWRPGRSARKCERFNTPTRCSHQTRDRFTPALGGGNGRNDRRHTGGCQRLRNGRLGQ